MIDETVAEIRAMQTHSSSVVAVKAARALTALTEREFPTVEEYLRALERNSSALRRANPSHASLHTTQRTIVERVSEADPDNVDAAKDATEAAIDDVADLIADLEDAAADVADLTGTVPAIRGALQDAAADDAEDADDASDADDGADASAEADDAAEAEEAEE